MSVFHENFPKGHEAIAAHTKTLSEAIESLKTIQTYARQALSDDYQFPTAEPELTEESSATVLLNQIEEIVELAGDVQVLMDKVETKYLIANQQLA